MSPLASFQVVLVCAPPPRRAPLLLHLLAPNLGPLACRPAGSLNVWSIGLGLDVNFFVAQNELIHQLAAAVGMPVLLRFVDFEIGPNIRIAGRVLVSSRR